jgi:competence protein ComEC
MRAGAVIVAVVVTGAAIGVVTPAPAVASLALAIAIGSLALAAITPSHGVIARVLATAALGVGGVSHGAAARDRALAPDIDTWFAVAANADARLDAPVWVAGRLMSDAVAAEGGVRLEVDVASVAESPDASPRRTRGVVQLHVGGTLAVSTVPDWTAGRRIVAPTLLRRPQVYRNPGGPSERWQRLRRPFALMGTVKSASLVEIEPGAWWTEAAAAVRHHVRYAVRRHLTPRDPQAAAIVTAILIGDRAGLSDEVERRLQASGTYHVIAISGGNVALVIVGAFAIARVVTRRHRPTVWLTLTVVLVYGAIVAGDPSVVRAITAACVYLVLDIAGLAPSARRVLALVALLLVVVNPLTVIDVGAWLSFAATAGIIVGVPRLVRAPRRGAENDVSRWPRRAIRIPLVMLAASLAAELVLLPIQAAVFNRLTLAGLVLNFVAIPAMAVVQAAGLATVALTGWCDVGASVAAPIAVYAARVLVDSSALLVVAPWLSWRVPAVSIWWSIVYYAGFVWSLSTTSRAIRRVGLSAAALAGVVIAVAPFSALARPAAPWLRLTAIDVGQGDAIAVQFPSGHSMLVDAGGSSSGFDIGGRVVVPALWALGIRRLDWVVVSHGDQDHVGGAGAVVMDLRPREVWEGVPVPAHAPLRSLREQAAASGAAWRTVHGGQRLDVGEVEVLAVHPPPPDWERPRVRNDDSLVLLLRYRDVEMLLTGDAASQFESSRLETAAAATPDVRRLRVLKIAHHGSRTSTSEAFVQSFLPDVAFVSLGAGNLFGHPAPEVMQRLAGVRAKVFRTDKQGAITLETDGALVRVTTADGATWEVRLLRPSGR